MTDSNESPETLEEKLATRFSQMRQEDRTQLPAFPDAGQLANREEQGRTTGKRAWLYTAAAAGVAALAVLLYPAADDPAQIYIEVMAANVMTTDQLLLVTPAVLPETAEAPGLFDADLSLEQTQMAN
jgi:hypothetical protein